MTSMVRPRTLVVFYSRTGTTQNLAHAIREELGCDIDVIREDQRRSGVLGYLRSALDSTLQRPTALRRMTRDVSAYDLVIVGTPVWTASVSAPVRTYLEANRDRIRRVAFFCTHGGSGSARALRQMEQLCGRHPLVTMVLRTEEVRQDAFGAKVRAFASALMNPATSREVARASVPSHAELERHEPPFSAHMPSVEARAPSAR